MSTLKVSNTHFDSPKFASVMNKIQEVKQKYL